MRKGDGNAKKNKNITMKNIFLSRAGGLFSVLLFAFLFVQGVTGCSPSSEETSKVNQEVEEAAKKLGFPDSISQATISEKAKEIIEQMDSLIEGDTTIPRP